MTPSAIALAVESRDDRMLALRDREDAAREAWIETRADAIYESIYDEWIADGSTPEQIEVFAVAKAKREAASGAWLICEEDVPY
ncbi:conserved protein of unknown function [Pararobbsia alpina]|uniref:hypothetical protein n=1 Tax=Pararobbsia alpina TaxID=621374 RepID=UPI0039A4B745